MRMLIAGLGALAFMSMQSDAWADELSLANLTAESFVELQLATLGQLTII